MILSLLGGPLHGVEIKTSLPAPEFINGRLGWTLHVAVNTTGEVKGMPKLVDDCIYKKIATTTQDATGQNRASFEVYVYIWEPPIENEEE